MASIVRIFRNRHNELRAGWRILLFVLLIAGFGFAVYSVVPSPFLATPAASSLIPFAIVFFATWIMLRFVNHKPVAAVGLWLHPRAAREWAIGLLLGFLMMTGIFLIELGLGVLHVSWRGLTPTEVAGAVGISLFVFAFSAMFEELLFRGYMFQTLMQWVTFLPALMIMSLLFGLGHLRNPHATPFSTANVLLAGVLLSFAYLKTRSLWLPFGLHLSWNFAQTTLYAFPTSGFAFAERRLFLSMQSGPEWITGGEFGPEGGVLATIALIAATWYILKTPLLRVPEGIITLDSVEDILPTPPRGGGDE
jgi:membrane protease YdiL (CAAX protease family)